MSDLESLGVKLVDQSHLEQSITQKANQVLLAKDAELDGKRLEKAEKDLKKVIDRIRTLQRQLDHPRTKISQKKGLREQIQWVEKNELEPVKQDISDIQARLKETHDQRVNPSAGAPNVDASTGMTTDNVQLPGETEREFLIRTGKITAFGNENFFQSGDQGDEEQAKSHTNLRAPGFYEEDNDREKETGNNEMNDDDDYNHSDESDSDEDSGASSSRNVDDGDELVFQQRLRRWVRQRSKQRNKENTQMEDDEPSGEDIDEEWHKPHPSIPDSVLNETFKLPGDIYPSLFDYQKTCVQWLWELYSQKTGGIIGDEMGLGKTIQVIAFIAGLHYSGLLDKPVLVVVPATVMNQWVNEFHRWWPPLRCVILHSIGSGMGKSGKKNEEDELEELLEKEEPSGTSTIFGRKTASSKQAQEIVDRVMTKGHVLVTTYVGLRIYSRQILPREWGYVVLDEGHKIRNPDSDISLTCKQLKTYNRIILSGTPIQNNLVELWSLFDFVFPGRLGTLPVFQQQFAVPINMGGYANASNIQVQTGYKCAVVLRDLISPYLLRRLKSDVAQDLPKKSEMVLFVKLTQLQQELYEKFLNSEDIHAILRGKRNLLMGVDMLRKICNHPDLIDREVLMRKRGYNYGNPAKSGKMQVLKSLLQLWQRQGHRTLLFCQTRQMLDILQKFVGNLQPVNDDGEECEGQFQYLRMDGSTAIHKRQELVDTFNGDLRFDVFLLTTKVGGLGVNLTGADRVIIYDPDWNPSTDIQARERAWRLGQKKDITIYRLMTAGSIEEKIYHRQIFKTFLTNKILKDPKQRRFFKMNDLHDLFTLGDPDEVGTETGDMFHGSEQNYGGKVDRKSNKLFKPKHKNDDDFYQVAGMNGVSKLDEFAGDGDEKEDETKDESRIMEGLFSQSGVHSALKHDDIMDSSKQELSIIEREASRVASDAAEALKESRRMARKTKVGTPTWTGKYGVAGKFGPKSSKIMKKPILGKPMGKPTKAVVDNPLSSSSILTELRSKKGVKFGSVFGKKTEELEKPSKTSKEETIEEITNFLNTQPNQFSSSENLLKVVKMKMVTQRDTVMIRSMLREVADWDVSKKGWKLKDEFKR
ncbi:DNA repair and recombination protein Rad26p [[Candida] anglica]|uniref:DNA repair and recombination protein Rad26p n=1 Tax=[Candida] anglica TaxID=148631 RepID=A0ABP0EF41_9ASCO